MIEKNFLYKEYVLNNKTAKEIGNMINKSDTQVRYWIKRHNLPMKPPGGRSKTIDLTNKVFGNLTVERQAEGDGQTARWVCKCSCGKTRVAKSNMLRRGEIKTCGKCRKFTWTGYEDISGQYYGSLKNNAKKRNISFDISKKFLWDLFVKQHKKCALSGIDIVFATQSDKWKQTASLDRIDPQQGYIESNVQWVHKDINRIKREYNEDIFLYYVMKIAEHKDLIIKNK